MRANLEFIFRFGLCILFLKIEAYVGNEMDLSGLCMKRKL